MSKRFLTEQEVADLLKVSRKTVYRYRMEGKLPYVKIGGPVLFDVNIIEKIIANEFGNLTMPPQRHRRSRITKDAL